jgi:tRNA(fMet)-specific endonuclease VapC
MNGRLLDTSAAVHILNGDAALTAYVLTLDQVYLSIISVGELFFGAYRSIRVQENLARVTKLTTEYAVLSCDMGTSQIYGELKQHLRQKGRPIPENDAWIAAIALRYDFTLVTRDGHFANVDNLTTEGW